MSDPVVVPSIIEAVQVFRRGATVVRRAVLEGVALEGGVPERIELAGLPLSLTDPTARVSVVEVLPSTATVTATGLQVGIHVRPGLPPEKAPAQQEIDDVAKKIGNLDELVRLIDIELGLLTGIPVPDRPQPEEGRAPPPAPLAMRLALEGFVDDAAEGRRLERRRLTHQIRELSLQHAALVERVRAASTAAAVKQSDVSKSVIVPLRTEGQPTRIVIEVRYIVPGARWAPAYHVKLARDGSSAVIHQRAHIAQRTGEDWTGVRLKLSTATPLRFSELPELSSVRIGKAQPPPQKKGFRPAPKGGTALFADHDRDRQRALAMVPRPASWSMPELQQPSAVSTSSGESSRGSNKKNKTMSIDRSELAHAAYVRAAPSLDDDDALSDMEMAESVEVPAPRAMRREEMARSPAPAPQASAMRGGPMAKPSRAKGGPGVTGLDEVVDAIVFPLLRLPGADDGARGRLVPVDTRRLYRESAERFGRPLPFDVAQLAANADGEANNAGGAVPPLCVDLSDLTSNFDFAYEADGVIDVVADGGWHSVPLGDRQCDASVRYVSVPREELAVYRVAVIQNTLGAPMLAGPAEISVGGEYVLTTQLPTVVAKGELTLGLGVEQAIKIARNARFKEVREGEGVVAMVELVHDIDVDVVNHLGRTIDIEVRERVPTAAEGAEVQVSERDVKPAWEPYDQEERGRVIDGGRRWRVQVAAGASQTLSARYVVRLFSNSEVQGGNRRER
jgi:uncharacterized protein (TIGR02231 family)